MRPVATIQPGKSNEIRVWRVGELAKRTGLTVRTLHYYEERGLLHPPLRSEGGYRLYTEKDVARLQQIASMRRLGFSLDDIAVCLERDDFSLRRVLALHIARLREQIEIEQELCRGLEGLARYLDTSDEAPAEAFLRTMEMMKMENKYYTPEQLEQLRQRAEQIGPDRIRAVEEEWPRLIAEVRGHMEQGTDPSDERVQKLAARWMELVGQFTGGDPGIAASLQHMYEEEPAARERSGIDGEIFGYVQRALEAKG